MLPCVEDLLEFVISVCTRRAPLQPTPLLATNRIIHTQTNPFNSRKKEVKYEEKKQMASSGVKPVAHPLPHCYDAYDVLVHVAVLSRVEKPATYPFEGGGGHLLYIRSHLKIQCFVVRMCTIQNSTEKVAVIGATPNNDFSLSDSQLPEKLGNLRDSQLH